MSAYLDQAEIEIDIGEGNSQLLRSVVWSKPKMRIKGSHEPLGSAANQVETVPLICKMNKLKHKEEDVKCGEAETKGTRSSYENSLGLQ